MEALLKTHDANCPRCDVETKIRHRPFSAQALAALIVWNEIAERLVGEAICDNCYDELREILIERNEEIHNPKPDKVETRKLPPVVAEKTVTKAAPAAASKTAPAAKSAPASKTVAKVQKKPAKPSKEKPKEKEKAAPGRGKKVRKVS